MNAGVINMSLQKKGHLCTHNNNSSFVFCKKCAFFSTLRVEINGQPPPLNFIPLPNMGVIHTPLVFCQPPLKDKMFLCYAQNDKFFFLISNLFSRGWGRTPRGGISQHLWGVKFSGEGRVTTTTPPPPA